MITLSPAAAALLQELPPALLRVLHRQAVNNAAVSLPMAQSASLAAMEFLERAVAAIKNGTYDDAMRDESCGVRAREEFAGAIWAEDKQNLETLEEAVAWLALREEGE
jgi:hypothetical protein